MEQEVVGALVAIGSIILIFLLGVGAQVHENNQWGKRLEEADRKDEENTSR